MRLSVHYPRLTEPIVYGMTFNGPRYVLQTDDSRYSLVPQWMLASTLPQENLNFEMIPARIKLLSTSNYKSDQKRSEIRFSFKDIMWVAQDTHYTIVAISTHDDRIEFLWRTSLRYALGKIEADRKIAKWLDRQSTVRITTEGSSQTRREDQSTIVSSIYLYSRNISEGTVQRSTTGVKKDFASIGPKVSSSELPVRSSEATDLQLQSTSISETAAKVTNERTAATLLALPPELHAMIFSYLEADDQDLAERLPSTWVSSWTMWQKSLVLTCKRFSQLLDRRLHEQTIMYICNKCCLSEAGLTLCEAGCRQSWHKLSRREIAHRIIRLEVRPNGRESVKTATAYEISSAISNCINLQYLR